jgi:FAD/FMN-containing dehydrogenase
MSLSKTILAELVSIVGPDGVITNDASMQSYMKEERGRLTGQSAAVLLPRSTQEVAALVRLCAKNKIALVPQSGNTGLTGASVPVAENPALCLSLKRMNKIRHLDAADFSVVAEAGCILQNLQETALKADRFFGMTLASEGSACIGGLIAANAGGSMTLRYGNMREQVLGLEVVLADGTIWNGLRRLRKNNSGYDLKQLMIGSEGTLGIITAASLKLFPKPTLRETAILALESPQKAIEALGLLRAATQDTLAAFEIMPRLAIETAAAHVPNVRDPFAKSYPWYALVETHETGSDGNGLLAQALAPLIEKTVVHDAALAQNLAQTKALWDIREGIVAAQKRLGASLKHDFSVPVSQVPALIAQGSALVQKLIPGIRVYSFGHAGDGNIHFNLSQPEGMEPMRFTDKREDVAKALHDLVVSLGGSISAEHGIGRFKRAEFLRIAPPEEIAAMRKIKQALDPENILNPGIIF